MEYNQIFRETQDAPNEKEKKMSVCFIVSLHKNQTDTTSISRLDNPC